MDTVYTVADAGRSYRMLDPGDGHIGRFIQGGVPYERKMLNFIRTLKLEGTALDVGAHVGNHSLYLAAVCGLTVWAFEPDPVAYDLLEQNLMLNPSLPITGVDCALGAETAHAAWRKDQKMALDPARLEGVVPVFRYDELDWPDDLVLVKIDVEGMEPQVLDGMRTMLAERRPLVFAEAHTDEAVRAQREVFDAVGYRTERYIHMGSRMIMWGPR